MIAKEDKSTDSEVTLKKAIESVGNWVAGVAILGLPFIWLVLFVLSLFAIASDSTTLWYTTVWLLMGSTWLLFCRKAKAETRLIVEITVWLASIALFFAAWVVG